MSTPEGTPAPIDHPLYFAAPRTALIKCWACDGRGGRSDARGFLVCIQCNGAGTR